LFALLAGSAYLIYSRAPAPSTAAGGRAGAGGGNRPLPVVAEVAKTGEMNVFLSALGAVSALNSVTVHSRVDGQLMRIAFKEGQLVRAGDVLAEIDPRPFQVQLTQAEGQLAKDQALLSNARMDVERYATLFAQDSIARQQLDTQRSLVAQYEGAIKADQGQVESAKLQLTYSRVTAPIGGRLGLRQVDAGNVVHASDANGIVVITQVRPISVVFSLPEDVLGQVAGRLRGGAKLAVDAYDREQKVKLTTGVVVTIDNQIDPTTGTIRLKAQFPNDDERLFPNQFVNVRVLIETLHDAVLIPTPAIQRGTQGTFVYIVNVDMTVSVRPVTLGPAQAESTSIAKGLVAGDKVVVDGADKLREGGKVELITREAQRAPGPNARMRGTAGGGQPRGEDRKGGEARKGGDARKGGEARKGGATPQ
ncbi:MAG: MdtA/MuxA family multidrug efflux RND transporter periplasmic adaptor subunit, partial [Betaproteobacteria bacterium]